MPQVVRTQITLNESDSTRDHIMNTWHCVTVGATTPLAAVTAFVVGLQAFYNSVDLYFASLLNTYVPRVRAFDLSEPKPRQPILEADMSALTAGTGSLPRELAICMSYRGTYVSGISPKRKRGRIYLGPLATSSVSSAGLVAVGVRDGIATAADTLLGVSDGSAEFRWVVYSPTSDPTGDGNDAACWDAVTEGWVDDNVDIQRRRSVAGGSRSEFT